MRDIGLPLILIVLGLLVVLVVARGSGVVSPGMAVRSCNAPADGWVATWSSVDQCIEWVAP